MTTSSALSRRSLLAASAAASLFLTARPSLAAVGGVTFVRDAAALAGNPVYAPWPGPNGGVPPWDKIKIEHLKPALVHANDNKALIADILKLRHERAGLLGHATHAHMRLHNTMTQTPQRAMTLLEQVWRPAVARVHEEVRDMQALTEGAGIKIAPWDYRYYQEKVRKARYDLDEGEVKAYLQLDQLRDAMFWAVGRNFGWTVIAADLPVYHPDVTAWHVKDAQERHVGYFYFDPFARSGKRSGAWMNQIRSQERFATAPGGLFDPALSRRYYDIALKVGNSRAPAETYRMLMGRDADPTALLRKRGFA